MALERGLNCTWQSLVKLPLRSLINMALNTSPIHSHDCLLRHKKQLIIIEINIENEDRYLYELKNV